MLSARVFESKVIRCSDVSDFCRIFWFFILVITFSWLFGSSNNSSNSSSTPLNSSNDDETFYYDDDFDCQEDFYSYEDYNSCDYDD